MPNFSYGSSASLQFNTDSSNTPKKTCETNVTPESSGSRVKSRLRAAGPSHGVRTATTRRPGRGEPRRTPGGAEGPSPGSIWSGEALATRPSGPTWREPEAAPPQMTTYAAFKGPTEQDYQSGRGAAHSSRGVLLFGTRIQTSHGAIRPLKGPSA